MMSGVGGSSRLEFLIHDLEARLDSLAVTQCELPAELQVMESEDAKKRAFFSKTKGYYVTVQQDAASNVFITTNGAHIGTQKWRMFKSESLRDWLALKPAFQCVALQIITETDQIVLELCKSFGRVSKIGLLKFVKA